MKSMETSAEIPATGSNQGVSLAGGGQPGTDTRGPGKCFAQGLQKADIQTTLKAALVVRWILIFFLQYYPGPT